VVASGALSVWWALVISFFAHYRQEGMRYSRAPSWFCAAFILTFVLCGAAFADANSERRIAVGAKLFSVLLAADQQLASKPDEHGHLPIRVLYADDETMAINAMDALQLLAVRDVPVDVSTMSLEERLTSDQRVFAVFIAQRLSAEELDALVVKSEKEGVILFSPFEGDVERGVLGGISVQASVRPYINGAALQRSGLDIKPFFLKVAKIYE
jgi:hypothetical protein